jgi:division/cell wall cluster transcriptional repressor MraZ
MTSLRLTGSHPQKMDEKDRVAIPARLIPVMREIEGVSEEEPLEIVITITAQQRLGIYPRKTFMKLLDSLETAPPDDPDVLDLKTTILNYMDEQSLDKQNRIRVPAMHAEVFGLTGEVVLMGSGEYLEVVSKETWKSQLPQRMADMPQKLRMLRHYTLGK